MYSGKKRDPDKLLNMLDDLKRQAWLGDRKVWLDYLFHFTHLRNVASILKHGALLSHDSIKRRRIPYTNISRETIRNNWINQHYHNFVRLYFRPCNPTTYVKEGFIPIENQHAEVRCSVPVILAFDHKKIITLERTLFSDGNLGKNSTKVFSSAEEFTCLPFEDIYSQSKSNSLSDEKIKNRMQAEVLYPESISLEFLRAIYCRSHAEKETLKNLVPDPDWRKWKSKVHVPANPQYFFQLHCLHVSKVALADRSIRIVFHKPTKVRCEGPFVVKVYIKDSCSWRTLLLFQRLYTDISFELPNLRLDLNWYDKNINSESAKVTIDNELAYLGRYDEIPF